jgi:hypothetical protein
MSCEVRLDPDAEAEVLSSLAWYSSRSDLAARSFVHELMRVRGDGFTLASKGNCP